MTQEEAKKKLDHLDELSRQKSMFISTVSHEFRTSITAISMNLQMLELYDQKWPPEKKEKLFRRLRSSIKTMVNLLDEVSMLSKDYDGKLSANYAEFDIVAVCRDCADKVNKTADFPSRITFTSDMDSLMVNTDSSFVNQILNNLLVNAVKFTPDGTDVVCSFEHPDPSTVVIRITDHGIGIPETEIEHLSEPFFRARNALHFPGSGLGLSVVKRALELLHGTLELQSVQEKGTTAIITLPIDVVMHN